MHLQIIIIAITKIIAEVMRLGSVPSFHTR